MASVLLHILNEIFKHMPVIEDTAVEREKNASRRQPCPPKGVTLRENYRGLPCEFAEKAGNGDIVVLNIHGGGFTTGSARESRSLTFYICDKLGYNCVACDYRLAPEHKLPAAFDDCFSVYRELVKVHPRLIIVGGSAGGSLALATALRAKRENISAPLAVAAFSPLAGIGLELPSHFDNVKTDYMLKRDPSGGELLKKLLPEGADKDFLKDARISPVFGDFRGFPPLFLSASDTEILYDDACILYEKAKESGVDCCFEKGHSLLHAWVGIPQLPEARKTLFNFKSFLKERGLCKN